MTRTVLTVLSLAAFGVLTAAVLICVGFTGSALVKANESLGVVDTELTSVSGNADPLTDQVHKVNASLVSIEGALNPLHGQADTLNGILTTVNQTLTAADGSVKSILSKAGPIETTLNDVDLKLNEEAREVGVDRASAKVLVLDGQVTSLGGILTPVEGDLSNIEGLLVTTDHHLHAACGNLNLLKLPALPLLATSQASC